MLDAMKDTPGLDNMLPTYKFGLYTFRPATAADIPLSRAWTAVDPDHIWERQFPHYWIQQSGRASSYVFEDDQGVLFFLKSIRGFSGKEVEINVQFDRERKHVSVLRLMIGLMAGFDWLKQALPMNGFKLVYFVSRNQNLCAFAEKRLGFVKDGDRMIYPFEGERYGEVECSQAQEVAQV